MTALRTTQPAPLAAEWVSDQTAATIMGVRTAEVLKLVAAGLLTGEVAPAGPSHGRGRKDGCATWVRLSEVIDLRDRSADPRQPDPLAGFARRAERMTVQLRPAVLRGGFGALVEHDRRGAAVDPEGGDQRAIKPESRESREARPVLYGLLTAADVAELDRRRELLALRRRAVSLPVLPGASHCPDCRRADLIEIDTRRRAARGRPC